MKLKKWICAAALAVSLEACAMGGFMNQAEAAGDLNLRTMGSLTFGGTVTTAANGETFHGDHGYAQYFIPQNAYNYPLVMWHGIGQSGACWETTPDGREGFMQLLPRRNWAVYIMDQPRRGRAGRTQAALPQEQSLTALRESEAWNAFRIGIWTPPYKAHAFDGLNFPTDPDSVNRFMRWQTPDTGENPRTEEYYNFLGDTVSDLFDQIGGGILLTHSRSGGFGWVTAIRAGEKVKAVVAYEPANFVFPEGESPAEIKSGHPLVEKFQQPQMVSREDFAKLTKIPIMIVYGDNIAPEQSDLFNPEVWRCASLRAQQFVDAINRHGGDATLVMLPKVGLKGNTHAPFADFNNAEVADHLVKFLHDKGLDKQDNPHKGPAFTLKHQK